MNNFQTLLRPLTWTLALGLSTALLLTGCGSDKKGGSSASSLTLLAGSMGGDGSIDGTGAAASLSQPGGATTDSAGNVYVADRKNCTIRRITPAGVTTTLAGKAGTCAVVDGTGALANFGAPIGIAADGSGNLYVAERQDHVIRKIVIATGVVTTLAGSAGSPGYNDDTGAAALFDRPYGLATDSSGNIYVAERKNYTIRKITPAGVVTTLAGAGNTGQGTHGSTDGTGAAATFWFPSAVAVSAGNVYVADRRNHTIRQIVIATGDVTTLAGTAGTSGSADGTGTSATFDRPSGIAVNSAGTNLYVVDRNNNTIRQIVIATGVVTTLAGTPGTAGSADGTGAAASFGRMGVGIATDSTGNIYVTDNDNKTIRKITSAGVVTTLAGAARVRGSADGTGAAASFNHTKGVTADSAGNIYVADGFNHTIRKITSAGVVTTFAGTAGAAGSTDATGAAASFNRPLGLTIDSTGNIYVADRSNGSVRKITPAGVVTTLATVFSTPHDLAVDSVGNVYVSNRGTGVINKIDTGGTVTSFATGFGSPHGLAVDSAGNVYVANRDANTIDKITPGGVVSLLAGSGSAGSADGTGAAASFNNPHGLTIDSAGNLYVADRRNNTIRKITPAGVVTTVAGVASTNSANRGVDTRGFAPGALPGYLPAPRFVALSGNTLYVTARHGVVKVTLP